MIKIDTLTKVFGRRAALDGLSLDLGDDDRVALIGANGAGKTTLIRCLLGHYTFHGEITVDGRSVRSHRLEALRRTAFVPQIPPPMRLPVGELLSFAEQLDGCRRDRVAALLDRLGQPLAGVERQPFWRLSGGQKQKILVSLALSREARLIILDEPGANLDPAARKVFFDLLAECRDCAFIISSHRLEEIAGLVNRVIELDRGKVVLDDRVADSMTAGERHAVHLRIAAAHAGFAAAISEWQFRPDGDGPDGDGLSWRGEVAAPDRLRFLGMLSRYAGLIQDLTMQPQPDAVACRAAQ